MTEPAASRSRAAVRQTWIDRFQRFANADLSVADFCAAEGVAAQTFYYWRNKLAVDSQHANTATQDPPRFLPVRLLAAPTPVELVLPSGAVLRLLPGCDLAFIRTLLDALGGTPC
jgi:hypothetical protein